MLELSGPDCSNFFCMFLDRESVQEVKRKDKEYGQY